MLVLVPSTLFLSVAKIFYLADLSKSFAEFLHCRSSRNFLDIAGTKLFFNLIFFSPFSSHFHPFPFFLILLIKKACWASTEGPGNGGVVVLRAKKESAGVCFFPPPGNTNGLLFFLSGRYQTIRYIEAAET